MSLVAIKQALVTLEKLREGLNAPEPRPTEAWAEVEALEHAATGAGMLGAAVSDVALLADLVGPPVLQCSECGHPPHPGAYCRVDHPEYEGECQCCEERTVVRHAEERAALLDLHRRLDGLEQLVRRILGISQGEVDRLLEKE